MDMIGKYRMTPKKGGINCTIKDKKDKYIYLQAATMIDPANGWIEIYSVPGAQVDLVANKIELAWITRYPLSN